MAFKSLYINGKELKSLKINDRLVYQKSQPITNTPLCFTALEGEDVILYNSGNSTTAIIHIDYSFDLVNWVSWVSLLGLNTICTLQKGQSVYIRCSEGYDGQRPISASIRMSYFKVSSATKISGDITSFTYHELKSTNPVIEKLFLNMFFVLNYTNPIVDASELIMPIETTSEMCYQMFRDCKLIYPPELKATTIRNEAYAYMFFDCKELVSVPDLMGDVCLGNCYYRMFYRCYSITSARLGRGNNFSDASHKEMFYDCKNLNRIEIDIERWTSAFTSWVLGVSPTGTFICPNKLEETYGVNYIPEGWTIVRK